MFKLPFRSCCGNLTEIPDSFSVLRSGVIIDLDLNRMLAEEFSLCLKLAYILDLYPVTVNLLYSVFLVVCFKNCATLRS